MTPILWDPQDPSISIRVACYYFARASTFTFIYGISVLLFLQSITVYITRKQSTRSQHWMFLISTITFILGTINESTVILETVIFIRAAFSMDRNTSPLEKYQVALKLMAKPNTIYQLVSACEILFSDCIIVWRAFVLLQYRRWLVIVPSLLLLCTFATDILFFWKLSKYAEIGLNQWENTISSIMISLSLATNIIATMLIFHVYWMYRKEMTSALGVRRATQAERILSLLIESGVIFCLLQVQILLLKVTTNIS
ncbi:hypothetical protein BDZ94DRAFT_1242486, partial [Collybia nuda]